MQDNDIAKDNEKSIGLNSLTQNLMSDVENAHVPDEVQNEIQQNALELNEPDIETDVDGNVFDPDLHASDKDGNPSLTKTGKFRAKRGVSKVAVKDAKKVDEVVKQKNNTLVASKVASGMFINMSCMVFGDEWKPVIDQETGMNEKAVLDEAFYNYFEAQEIKDFPPSVGLAMALGMYSMGRMTQPKTQSKLSRIKDAIAGKYLTWRSKRNGTHSGTGKNGKREKHDNKEASQTSK